MKLLGVILAGGKSLRMGTDKGLVEYKGKLMVQYAIDLMETLCDDIVISTNSMDYLEFGYQTIPDLIQDIGPIGGLYSVMNMLQVDKYFFISCDIPLASRLLAEELMNFTDKGDMIIPVHSNDKIEPLFGLYSANVLPLIKEQIEKKNFKLMDLLANGNTYYHHVSDDFLRENPGIFKNINTQRDVE